MYSVTLIQDLQELQPLQAHQGDLWIPEVPVGTNSSTSKPTFFYDLHLDIVLLY